MNIRSGGREFLHDLPTDFLQGVAAAGTNVHVRTGTKGILLRAVTPMLSYFGSIFAFTRIVMIARDYRKLKVLLGPTFKVLLG